MLKLLSALIGLSFFMVVEHSSDLPLLDGKGDVKSIFSGEDRTSSPKGIGLTTEQLKNLNEYLEQQDRGRTGIGLSSMQDSTLAETALRP